LNKIIPESKKSQLVQVTSINYPRPINGIDLKTLEFSPDGQKVVIDSFNSNQNTQVWSWKEDSKKNLFDKSIKYTESSFCPDSEHLIFTDTGIKISKIDKSNNEKDWLLNNVTPIFIKCLEYSEEKAKGAITVDKKGRVELLQ
jgi:hypothetical protein